MISFISIKSFGDMIILINCITKFNKKNLNYKIISAKHLSGLINEIKKNFELNVQILDTKQDFPSFFNIKKSNLNNIVLDYLSFYKILNNEISTKTTIICDIQDIRYNLLFPFNKIQYLKKFDNIYLDYANFFDFKDFINNNNKKYINNKSIGIFLDSSVERKKINLFHQNIIINILEKFHVNKFIYNYNKNIYENSQKSKIYLYSSFQEIFEIINKIDIVISTDSFTAHLAELYNKDIFVISPSPNIYWLPLSSYTHNSWCTFKDLESNSTKLHQFLEANLNQY